MKEFFHSLSFAVLLPVGSSGPFSLATQHLSSKTQKEAWYCTPLLQSEVVGIPYNADMETAHAVSASRHTVPHYNSEISYVSDRKNEHNASLYSINQSTLDTQYADMLTVQKYKKIIR